MFDIAALVGKLFRMRWTSLHGDDWDSDVSLRNPGIYLLACSHKRLVGQRVRPDDVHYVGMSNSRGGVRARLKQFKQALQFGYGHSAGDYCFKQNGSRPFRPTQTKKAFYFATWCIDVPRDLDLTASNLRKLGHVACLEYYAIAHVRAKGRKRAVPPLNRATGGELGLEHRQHDDPIFKLP